MQIISNNPNLLNLNHVNSHLVTELRNQNENYTAQRLTDCRHGKRSSWCRQGSCTLCSRRLSFDYRHRATAGIAETMAQHPNSVHLFATLTTHDCEIWELHERLSRIGEAWRSMRHPTRRRSTILGIEELAHYGQIELVPSPISPDGWNAHLHAVSLLPEGADSLRSDVFEDLWRNTIKDLARSANVQPVSDLEAVLRYVAKDFFVVRDYGTGQTFRPEFLTPNNRLLTASKILTVQERTAGQRKRFFHGN